jgi:hypothetical protein
MPLVPPRSHKAALSSGKFYSTMNDAESSVWYATAAVIYVQIKAADKKI